MIFKTRYWLALAALVFAGSVFASPLTLNYRTTADVLNGNAAVVSTITASPSALAVPGSTNYGQSFFSPTPDIAGLTTGYGFVDTYVFTISSAVANSITTTINLANLLGINNFEERLYAFTGAPVLGNPGPSLIQAWTLPVGNNQGFATVIDQTNLAAGTYALEIRGDVFGQFGGSYSGVLNLAAAGVGDVGSVPVPAAVWLMGTAVAGLFSAARKKS